MLNVSISLIYLEVLFQRVITHLIIAVAPVDQFAKQYYRHIWHQIYFLFLLILHLSGAGLARLRACYDYLPVGQAHKSHSVPPLERCAANPNNDISH